MTTTVHGPGDPAEQETTVTFKTEDSEVTVPLGVFKDVVGISEQDSEPLFDPKPYRTQTPVFDNLSSDKLTIAFGGAIELDATDPEDIATFERFTLGRPVRLVVEGYTAAKNATYKENADGEVTVTGKAGVRVHSLTLQDG